MAITTKAQPKDLSPAYNPNYYYFDSTSKTELGYRYLVSILRESNNELIGKYSLRPIPTNLYGEVDVSKLLQTALGFEFNPDQTTFKAVNHIFDYKIEVDEEYLINHPMIGYGIADDSNWSNFNDTSINPNGLARTRLIHTTQPPFTSGDIINVEQIGGANYRSELEGIQTVLDVEQIGGSWATILSLPWIGGGSASSNQGFTSYADGKKTIIEGIQIQNKQAFRGAIPFNRFNAYNDDTYRLTDTNSKFLTTLPKGVRVANNAPTWLAGYFEDSNVNIEFNINGTLYRYSVLVEADTISNFDVLPTDNNIEEVFNGSSWVTFAGGLDLSNVTSYTVQAKTTGGTVISEVKTINLYNECDRYDLVTICFLDRLGSWVSIPFNKALKLDTNVNRKEYRKKYGGFDVNKWNYNNYDSGKEAYHVAEELSYTVNSGQLSETESNYMKELLSTPKAFVQINGEEWQSINITTSNINLPKKRTDRQRNLTLNFTMSVQDSING